MNNFNIVIDKYKEYKHYFKKHNFYNLSGFKRYYNEFIYNDDRLKMYDECFELFKDLNVLDIGSQIGFYSTLISPYANKVIAIDKENHYDSFKHLKDKLEIKNIYFYNLSVIDFYNRGLYEKLNINSLFIHKCTGYMKEKDLNCLKELILKSKLIITSTNIFNDLKEFDVDSKKYINWQLHILKKK